MMCSVTLVLAHVLCSDSGTCICFVFWQWYVYMFCVLTLIRVYVLCSDSGMCICFVFWRWYVYMFCVLTVVRVYVFCSDSGTCICFVFWQWYVYMFFVLTLLRKKKCLTVSEIYDLFHSSASEYSTVHYTLRVAEYPGGSWPWCTACRYSHSCRSALQLGQNGVVRCRNTVGLRKYHNGICDVGIEWRAEQFEVRKSCTYEINYLIKKYICQLIHNKNYCIMFYNMF